MAPVFAHGRLRLYLLKLLDEAPRHGYEVIRLLEERFHGLYAPSAGTVYPRLAKLEAEGLVTHATEGGRKVYSITDAGRAELAGRSGELADLELEIRESV
ncbi:MAG TPA: PadR family transcriptional regulator, partial [Gemmatimonadales bacterium]|nr:PadR family transcriptional regulator [Gemmatimonadales bacterium]